MFLLALSSVELGKALEARGLNFARYADDCNIYVKREKATERVMKTITNFMEGKLDLNVNSFKSKLRQTKRH